MAAVRDGRYTAELTCDADGCDARLVVRPPKTNAFYARIQAGAAGWGRRPWHGSHRLMDLCPQHDAEHTAELERRWRLAGYIRPSD